MAKTYLPLVALMFTLFFSNEMVVAQTYCSAGPDFDWDTGIEEVVLMGQTMDISHNSAGLCADYSDLTAVDTADVVLGNSYSLTVTTGACAGFFYERIFKVYADWNGDYDFNDPGEEVAVGAYQATGPAAPQLFTINVPGAATTGFTRLRVVCVETNIPSAVTPCASFLFGEVEDYTLRVVGPVNDASISALESPQFPTCAMDSVVKVKLMNAGSNPLTSVIVSWSLNGVAQPNYIFTGNVPSTTDTILTLGTVTGGLNNGDVLVVSSSSPNNAVDPNPLNDTLTTTLYNSLGGMYTVGSSSSADFNTINDALGAASNYGICAPTTFSLIDPLYNEQIVLGSYLGMDTLNTITITSASGNPADVTLQYASSNVLDRAVITTTNASHYVINGLTIENTGSTYSGLIQALGNSQDIVISNNILVGALATSTSTAGQFKRGVYLEGIGNSNWELTGNHILNCDYAIYANTPWQSVSEHLTITDNLIESPYYAGIQVTLFNHTVVNGNSVIDGTGNNGYGISIRNSEFVEISNNYVRGLNNWPQYGVHTFTLSGNLTQFVKVYNNKVYLTRVGIQTTGISSAYNVFASFYHNSVYVFGNTTDSRGIYVGNGQYNNFYNNIFYVANSGVAFYEAPGASSVNYMDYNNFSAPSGGLFYKGGTSYTTLNSWTNATGLDSNSLNVNGVWVAPTELTVCTDSLYGKGLPNSGATSVGVYSLASDYDGQLRQSTPCIGADEYLPGSNFQSVNEITLCDGDSLILNQPYYDTVVWNGTIWATSFQVSQPQTVTLMASGGCGLVSDTIDIIGQSYVQFLDTSKICDDESKLLSTDVINGSYQWSTGETTPTITIDSAQMVWVSTLDSIGCSSSDTITIEQHHNVELPDSTFFCENADVTLSPGVPGTYLWSDQSTNSQLVVNQENYYAVTVTDGNCISADTIYVEEELDVIPSFSDSTDFHTVLFTNTSGNVTPNCTFLWDFGDGTTSTEENPIHVFPWSGGDSNTYEVTLHVINRCDTFSVTKTVVVIVISVSELQSQSILVHVYPNPVNTHLQIHSTSSGNNMMVTVYDTKGAALIQKQIGTYAASETYTLDMSRLSAGMYIAHVEADGQRQTIKVSKQ